MLSSLPRGSHGARKHTLSVIAQRNRNSPAQKQQQQLRNTWVAQQQLKRQLSTAAEAVGILPRYSRCRPSSRCSKTHTRLMPQAAVATRSYRTNTFFAHGNRASVKKVVLSFPAGSIPKAYGLRGLSRCARVPAVRPPGGPTRVVEGVRHRVDEGSIAHGARCSGSSAIGGDGNMLGWYQGARQAQIQSSRRHYSGQGNSGGGQHFPHTDQDSLGLFAGDSSKRVIKPERIIIVRHGESLGNLDESTYVHVPDWKIPLTKKGFVDGQRAGEKIKEYIGDKPLFIYTSPYLRTKQTLAGMVEAFDTNYIVGVREEPRLTEQQFGNFQNLATIVNSKAERARFGRFYYRFPQGESGLDVYNRATSFIATMFRDFANENIARDDLNVIIITHGLTLRLLVMRWFQYSIADFEETLNPANGGFVVMERKAKHTTDSRFFKEQPTNQRDIRHWYELTPESRAHINFREQRQFGSLWKLLSELPDEPGVIPDEFKKPHD